MRKPFLRFEVDVRGAQAHGFFEHGLQQFDDRRILGARRQTQQVAKLDGRIAQLGSQLLGQAGDLLAPVINAVDHGQQLAFGKHGKFDIAFDEAGDFVIGLQVGRIGEADLQTAVRQLIEHQGPETAGRRFRQQFDQLRLRGEILEVNEGDAQLAGQCLGNPPLP